MPNTNPEGNKQERIDARMRELLDSIAEAHATLSRVANEDDPTITVRAITAVPMDDALREKVLQKAEKLYNAPVMLKERVDPAILGGIILEAPTRRYDASVRSQLSTIKHGLTTARKREEA